MSSSQFDARKFYDKFGSKQNWQKFYESDAITDLITQARFEEAASVIEFGCGTGQLAATLLEKHLPSTAQYLGVDISSTMVSLSQERLGRFGTRAQVQLSEGQAKLDVRHAAFDRFVSTYVMDLLPDSEIRAVIAEAHRLLTPGGILTLASLTHGCTWFSRIVESAWTGLFSLQPKWVGGCRPISLIGFMGGSQWKIIHQAKFVQFGIPSEVIVAEQID